MPMFRWFSYFAVIVSAITTAGVPSLVPVETLIPQAHVEDAVFVDGNRIVVLTSEPARPTDGQMRCSLSVWDIERRVWLLKKSVEAISPFNSCGSLGYSPSLHRLVINANTEVLLINPETLDFDGKISVKPDHIAAMWERDDILYALSEPGHKPLTLTSYRMSTGAMIRKTFLEFDYSQARPLRVAAIPNNQLAFLQNDVEPLGVPRRNSAVAICAQQQELTCKTVPLGIPVANFLVLDDSLLFVSDDFPDRSAKSRKQCIGKLSLSTLQVNPDAYCRPDAGVHYSIAVLGSNLILGYSGYGARRGWLDDGMVASKSRSTSIWERKSGRLTAIAPVPGRKSFDLTSSVIRADTSGTKRFLFFNQAEDGEILLYDVGSVE